MKIELIISIGMILVGLVLGYIEYDPTPKNIEKKDLWKFWKYGMNGIIGESLIIVGIGDITSYIFSSFDSMSDFWTIMILVADLGACFLLPWLVHLAKYKIACRKEDIKNNTI
ncbi:MAG: hypothetical protein MJZ77_06470 [Bacteroidales bacterium]|nr:hypothetical protein [Bacteroidales bacterium]